MPSSIVIIGPAHPLRGGLASFNERLARAFQQQGNNIVLYTFSLQYPSLFFPGTTQYSSEPPPNNLTIKACINSVNPFNWYKIGNELRKLQPDIIVVRYWMPFMAPCFGTILRLVKKNHHTKIICIADNIIPHEKRFADTQLTRYFIKPVDAFITMSEKVMSDLKRFTTKPARRVAHPLYDNFGTIISKEEARKHLQLPLEKPIILFFGFIRHYKGLDILLRAMAAPHIQQQGIKLLVAGEFYEDEKPYKNLIQQLKIESSVILKTQFVPDSEVRYFLCACDFVIQPYREATQSGVTPLAYYFEKPMLVTNVGGLPAMVPNKKAGLVAEPVWEDIAEKILELYQLGENYFIPFLREEKKKYSWEALTETIFLLAAEK